MTDTARVAQRGAGEPWVSHCYNPTDKGNK